MKQHLVVLVIIALTSGAVVAQGGGGQLPGAGQGGLRGQARAVPPRDDAPRGTSVMRGQVVSADTGVAIRHAQVRISSLSARESRLASTDAQGRFEVKDLPAGRYTISASKGGFVSLQYGQRRPSESGTPIELSDGQKLDKLTIALPRGSVIGGRITDEFGEPVANASVLAMRYSYAAGGRRLTAAVGSNSRDSTDDQGNYRLFGLPPGDYFVSATLRLGPDAADPTGEVSGYAATYFPGTSNLNDAARVTLAVSQENTTVSFGLIATKLVRVTGQVLTSAGTPASGGMVMLMPSANAAGRGVQMQQGGGGGRIDQTGAFTLSNIAPGRYQVQARSGGGRGGDGELAKMDLTVGAEDVSGLTMVTAPGAIVTGSVVSDTGEPLDFAPQQLQIAARAATIDAQGPAAAGGARVAANWTFELRGLTDARLFRVSAPQGWTLKSVGLAGQDITDVPTELPPGQSVSGMQIVLTKKTTTLSGAVADSRGQPLLDATVVVFPANDRLWTFQSRFIKAARPDQEGVYRLSGLPPSEDYLIVAVQGLEDGQAGDPEFLATVKDAATKFTLADGETKAVDVKLAAPK